MAADPELDCCCGCVCCEDIQSVTLTINGFVSGDCDCEVTDLVVVMYRGSGQGPLEGLNFMTTEGAAAYATTRCEINGWSADSDPAIIDMSDCVDSGVYLHGKFIIACLEDGRVLLHIELRTLMPNGDIPPNSVNMIIRHTEIVADCYSFSSSFLGDCLQNKTSEEVCDCSSVTIDLSIGRS